MDVKSFRHFCNLMVADFPATAHVELNPWFCDHMFKVVCGVAKKLLAGTDNPVKEGLLTFRQYVIGSRAFLKGDLMHCAAWCFFSYDLDFSGKIDASEASTNPS